MLLRPILAAGMSAKGCFRIQNRLCFSCRQAGLLFSLHKQESGLSVGATNSNAAVYFLRISPMQDPHFSFDFLI